MLTPWRATCSRPSPTQPDERSWTSSRNGPGRPSSSSVFALRRSTGWARPDRRSPSTSTSSKRPASSSRDARAGTSSTISTRRRCVRSRTGGEVDRREALVRITVTSVLVDDQEKALRFYTDVLGFQKKADIPLGPARWLTVVSPNDPDGTELLLEPDEHPAARPFKDAL